MYVYIFIYYILYMVCICIHCKGDKISGLERLRLVYYTINMCTGLSWFKNIRVVCF